MPTVFKWFIRSFAILGANHIKVVDSAGPGRFKGRDHGAIRDSQQTIVLGGAFATLGVPLREMGEFRVQQTGLNCVQSTVITLDIVIILFGLAVIS